MREKHHDREERSRPSPGHRVRNRGLGECSDGSLINGDFEARAAKKDEIAGFTTALGVQNGGPQPASEVVLDAKEKHGGKQSLKIAGTDTTRGWRSLDQQLPVRPGATYRLTGFIKTENIKPGVVKGTQIPHFQNCHIGVFAFDGKGELVVKDMLRPQLPTSPWTSFDVKIVAPPSTQGTDHRLSLDAGSVLARRSCAGDRRGAAGAGSEGRVS